MNEHVENLLNGAAEQFTDAIIESYRVVAERQVSAQELNAELVQRFFTTVSNNLRQQSESNWEMSQQLIDQQQRFQEATQELTKESINAYTDFMNSLFSFYQGNLVHGRLAGDSTTPPTVPPPDKEDGQQEGSRAQ